MEKVKTNIEGVELLIPKIHNDHRGSFSEIFNDTFPFCPAQINWVESVKQYTFRGLHYQFGDYAQAKIVKCVSGAILDIALDIRKDSPTFGKYLAVEINDWNSKMIYLAEGLAHGYLTLNKYTKVLYFCSKKYQPDSEAGIRLDDPAFSIKYLTNPINDEIISFEEMVVSVKDRNWPFFSKD